ncbi:MAG: type I-G CRISPR-associated protein, Cas3-extension family, partial [Sulfobacillus sp.]
QESSHGPAATGVAQLAIATYREYMPSIARDVEAQRWMGLVTEWPENKKKSKETITEAKNADRRAQAKLTLAQKSLVKWQEEFQQQGSAVVALEEMARQSEEALLSAEMEENDAAMDAKRSKAAAQARRTACAYHKKLLAARAALDNSQRELAEAQERVEEAAEVARMAGDDLVAVENALEGHSEPELHYASTSRLHMLTGGQTNSFLKFIREAALVAADKPDAFTEALQGPWRFEDSPAQQGQGWDETSLGWYTNTQRGWAYSAGKPEKMKKTTTASVAWLAGEGLSSLPTWIGGKEVKTTGILGQEFTLPLWDTPLSLAVVRRLLMSVDEDYPEQWRRRGVTTLLQCEKGASSTEYKPVWLSPRVLW